MSTVFLHVGQCGNQLGQAVWEEACSSRWSGGSKLTSLTSATTGRTPSLQSSHSSASRPSPRPVATSAKPRVSPAPRYVPLTLIDGTIPCVLVDTEPKVIRQCLDRRHGSAVLAHRVQEEFCITDKTGRGNNWAYGYYGRRREGGGGEDLLGRVCEAVRKMVERCDRFSGFLMLHSIAGGTGSGIL